MRLHTATRSIRAMVASSKLSWEAVTCSQRTQQNAQQRTPFPGYAQTPNRPAVRALFWATTKPPCMVGAPRPLHNRLNTQTLVYSVLFQILCCGRLHAWNAPAVPGRRQLLCVHVTYSLGRRCSVWRRCAMSAAQASQALTQCIQLTGQVSMASCSFSSESTPCCITRARPKSSSMSNVLGSGRQGAVKLQGAAKHRAARQRSTRHTQMPEHAMEG